VVGVDAAAPALGKETVTPCNFMQFRYEAKAALVGPLVPPGPPFGRNLAHALKAGLLAKPPAPPGGAPPEKPDGGTAPVGRLGSVSPCWERHFWNAANDPLLDVFGVVEAEVDAPLLPHAARVRTKAATPRAVRSGVRRITFIRCGADRVNMSEHDDTSICDLGPDLSRVS
jgi:hypothetical protein